MTAKKVVAIGPAKLIEFDDGFAAVCCFEANPALRRESGWKITGLVFADRFSRCQEAFISWDEAEELSPPITC